MSTKFTKRHEEDFFWNASCPFVSFVEKSFLPSVVLKRMYSFACVLQRGYCLAGGEMVLAVIKRTFDFGD
jgi:hypothetical protein